MANKENTKLKEESLGYPNWVLTDRQICDLEMILNGAFSPLLTFNNQKDYEEILINNKLLSGVIWPIPIVLDVPDDFLKALDLLEILAKNKGTNQHLQQTLPYTLK